MSRCGDYEVGMDSWIAPMFASPILADDHDHWIRPCSALGDSLEAIAEQRAGIIKQGSPYSDWSYCPRSYGIDQIAEKAKECSMGML